MQQYREYCKRVRQRNAPRSPRPFGLGPKRASAASRSLRIFAILASSRSLHPSRFGPNALRVGLIQRFPKRLLYRYDNRDAIGNVISVSRSGSRRRSTNKRCSRRPMMNSVRITVLQHQPGQGFGRF